MSKKNISNLDDYFLILKEKKIIQKNESVTSHLFVAYLYKKLRVKPYDLFPQGHTKRGPIDFTFLPKDRELTVLVEIKSYGAIRSMDKIDNYMNQLKDYMKTKQKELKAIGRLNKWTIGIITDLLNTKIIFRNTKWGNKTNEYLILEKSFPDFLALLKNTDIKSIFNRNLNSNYISGKLWKEDENRYKAINELLKKYKDLSNYIRKKWKYYLPKDYPRGSINKVFNRTKKLLFEECREKQTKYLNSRPQFDTALKTLILTINKENCKKLIQKKAEEYFGLKIPKNTKLIKD